MNTTTGISKHGDLQEALNLAIADAQKHANPDSTVTWTLEKVSGVRGTFVGKNELTVTITYTATP